MKPISLVLALILLLQACSHRTVLTKAVTRSTAPVSPTAPPAPVAFIVVDGMGNIRTPKTKLPPTIARQVNYTIIARAFTPNQRKNLIYRFNTIPPKIIYVAPEYTQHSLKGTYCIYKKKFWYWQHSDGLFYLDETYYR
ncbi:hypothetical protein [Hydrotalea sp.]|uniref:hypothetical protein n=1 Tax=Hydrotalea sp. TaxID=2881279 RepID=UPI00263120F2|nr:hypothetical protein [Hydrotalea sp.]